MTHSVPTLRASGLLEPWQAGNIASLRASSINSCQCFDASINWPLDLTICDDFDTIEGGRHGLQLQAVGSRIENDVRVGDQSICVRDLRAAIQIGRASCRERVCQYV